MEVRIRSVEANDAAAIDRLILCLDAFHAQARPDLFRTPAGRPRGENFLQASLDDAGQQILVAVMGGEVVGYVHVVIKNTAANDHRFERHYSEIDTISVHPSSQRLGVGRRLIEAAISWATSKGIDDHQIAVHEFNTVARGLYEQLGFAPSVTLLRRQR